MVNLGIVDGLNLDDDVARYGYAVLGKRSRNNYFIRDAFDITGNNHAVAVDLRNSLIVRCIGELGAGWSVDTRTTGIGQLDVALNGIGIDYLLGSEILEHNAVKRS